MVERLQTFYQNVFDSFWVFELVILAVSWVILRSGAKPRRAKTLALEAALLFLCLALCNMLLISLLQTSRVFPLLWGLIHGLIALAYLRLRSAYRRRTDFALWCALYAAILSLSAIAGQCSYLFGMFVARGTAEGVIRVAVYLVMPVVAWRLRRYNFDDYAAIPNSGLRMILFGTAGVLVLYVVEIFYFQVGHQIVITLLAAYLCMFAMVLSAIRGMYLLCREQAERIELQTEKQRFLAEREMTQMAETTLENLRCIRHDLKNQYSLLQILLTQGRYEELKAYFDRMQENLPAQLSYVDCGNRTMNTVLNMEFSKIKSEQITVEHQLVVPPVLPFPDADICAIVTNLLDNAAEECGRLLKNGWESAKIRIEIRPHQSYLVIRCSNSTDRQSLERTGGGLRTTKEDAQLHGYGTRIVSKTAEKYNGCANYSLEDGQFVAQVMLDMMAEEAK